MHAIIDFAKDVWDLSVDRIHRADPLLMGAAIAYNSLFALVPLAIAFVALLTFFDRTDEVLLELYALFDQSLSPELAAFLTSILSESVDLVSSQRTTIIAVSLIVALWSGSRAVYAAQKALRTVEGVDETRGYVRSRLLGIAVTLAAAVGVMIAYTAFTLGERFWRNVSSWVGFDTSRPVRVTLGIVAIAWVWALLYAIYRWGPPVPVPRSGVMAAIVSALLVIGSVIAFDLSNSFPTTLSAFGAIGVFLVWLYYMGVVVVGAPTIISAIGGAIATRTSR